MYKADAILDVKGLIFPMPLLKVKKIIGTMAPGQVLEVIMPEQDIGSDICMLARKLGHELLEGGRKDGRYCIFIRKCRP